MTGPLHDAVAEALHEMCPWSTRGYPVASCGGCKKNAEAVLARERGCLSEHPEWAEEIQLRHVSLDEVAMMWEDAEGNEQEVPSLFAFTREAEEGK